MSGTCQLNSEAAEGSIRGQASIDGKRSVAPRREEAGDVYAADFDGPRLRRRVPGEAQQPVVVIVRPEVHREPQHRIVAHLAESPAKLENLRHWSIGPAIDLTRGCGWQRSSVHSLGDDPGVAPPEGEIGKASSDSSPRQELRAEGSANMRRASSTRT